MCPRSTQSTVNLVRVIVDVVMLILACLPTLILDVANAKPTQRGFFCNDESIRYPLKDSTISSTALILVSGFLNLTVVAVTEVVHFISVKRRKSNAVKPEPVACFQVNRCLFIICGYMWAFGFGIMTTYGLTAIGKWSIGRLRPHFIDGCEISNKTLLTSCTIGEYITEFECNQKDEKILKDLRLSFPSGHASISAFAMIYLVYYLQQRMPRFSYSYLFKSVTQYVCIMMAWYCALSRVHDYKHHPTDVLAGGILGTVVALLVGKFVVEGFRDPYASGVYPRAEDVICGATSSNADVENGSGEAQPESSPMNEDRNRTNL